MPSGTWKFQLIQLDGAYGIDIQEEFLFILERFMKSAISTWKSVLQICIWDLGTTWYDRLFLISVMFEELQHTQWDPWIFVFIVYNLTKEGNN